MALGQPEQNHYEEGCDPEPHATHCADHCPGITKRQSEERVKNETVEDTLRCLNIGKRKMDNLFCKVQ